MSEVVTEGRRERERGLREKEIERRLREKEIERRLIEKVRKR